MKRPLHRLFRPLQGPLRLPMRPSCISFVIGFVRRRRRRACKRCCRHHRKPRNLVVQSCHCPPQDAPFMPDEDPDAMYCPCDIFSSFSFDASSSHRSPLLEPGSQRGGCLAVGCRYVLGTCTCRSSPATSRNSRCCLKRKSRSSFDNECPWRNWAPMQQRVLRASLCFPFRPRARTRARECRLPPPPQLASLFLDLLAKYEASSPARAASRHDFE